MKRVYLLLILVILFYNCKKDSSSFLKEEDLQLYDWTDKNIEEFYTGNSNLIILNYWATFCSPCKEEMKDFVKLYNEYKDKNVLIIGASLDQREQLELIKKILIYLGVNYPVLYGVKPNFNGVEITGIPKTFIIKNNKVILDIDGKRSYDFFKKIIEENK